MQAFEGYRVLDLTHVLAGPFSTYQLALMGADVIKIESQEETDMNREVGPVDDLNRRMMGSHFQSQSANKRAITLNLKSEEGRAVFLDLVKTSDVVVENFRPGTMDKFGLGYEDLKALRPDLIYCSISGFGHTGPKAGHGAFDHVIQAYSGLMETTGPADDRSVIVGPPLLDYGTGAQASYAITAALLRRERCGKGQRIDVAMLDCALTMMESGVLNYSLTGKTPGRTAEGRDYVAAYGCYDASDARLMIGTFTPKHNARMWKALGRDDLAAEMDGLRTPDMPARRERDEALLIEIIKTRTADEWEEILNVAGVPAARVRTLDEALESEQVASREIVGHFTRPEEPDRTYRPAVGGFTFAEDGQKITSSPPELGQDTDAILAELGYDTEKIAILKKSGAI